MKLSLEIALLGLIAVGTSGLACTAEDDPHEGAGGAGNSAPVGSPESRGGSGAGSPIGGGSGGSETGDPDASCTSGNISYAKVIPNVLVLVDASSSMFATPFEGTPESRWDVTRDTLLGEQSPLMRLQGSVRFGFAAYTGDPSTGSCPIVDTLPPALNQFDDITASYEAVEYNAFGDTPTGDAVREATKTLLLGSAPRAIILATDGEPDTCAVNNPQCGQDDSIAAIQEAFDQGVRTFVLGIGNQVGAEHLQDIANAGQGAAVEELGKNLTAEERGCVENAYLDLDNLKADYSPTGGAVEYYVPGSSGALQTASNEVVSLIESCTFALDVRIDAERASRGSVRLNDEELTYGEDWTMPSEDVVTLLGAACGESHSPSAVLEMGFPCDARGAE